MRRGSATALVLGQSDTADTHVDRAIAPVLRRWPRLRVHRGAPLGTDDVARMLGDRAREARRRWAPADTVVIIVGEGDVEGRLSAAGLHDVRFEPMPPLFTASYTSPTDPLVRLARANAALATGQEPQLTITFAATDARYFRPRGVPTVIFGPRPNNMAALDEFITVEDLVTVTKVHVGTALDFLLDSEA